jgi:peptide/nickel transport system substrate-binding protein
VKLFFNLFSLFSQHIKDFAVSKWVEFKRLRKIKIAKNHDTNIVAKLSGKKIPSWKQFKRLPQTLSAAESFAIKLLIVVIILVGGFLLYDDVYKKLITVPANGGEFTEGLIGSPLYINPILAPGHGDANMDLSRLIFSGLLKYNDKLEIVPDLADKYEVSEDRKTYTFYLKQNVKWHDGEDLTAADVVFTINSIQNPDFKSPLFRSFQGITAEKIDDYTVKFTLNESYVAFLNLLTVGIIPQHIWYNNPAQNAIFSDYNKKPIGSGPYKFKTLIKEKGGAIKVYTLEKNKNYYTQLPYINKIVFKFYPDYETAVNALVNKEIQNLSYLPKEYLKKFSNKREPRLYNINLSQISAIFFNQKNNELLKDKNIREALTYAINKKVLIEDVLQSQGKAIDGPLPEGFLGYNPDLKKYENDQQKALEILTNNGWALDGEYLKKKDQELKIVLTTVEQAEYIKIADLLKEFWNSIGVNVEVQIIAKEKIEKDIIMPRNYQALLYGEVIGNDSDLYPFWHSSQKDYPGANLSGYVNGKTDQLLEEARLTADPQVRDQKYKEFQNILIDDLPAIFLYSPTYTYPLSNKIKNVNIKMISVPSDRFNNITDWYIKTKKRF